MDTKENMEAEGGSDADNVLVNELGQSGLFQLMNILLVTIPTIMSTFMSECIFHTGDKSLFYFVHLRVYNTKHNRKRNER